MPEQMQTTAPAVRRPNGKDIHDHAVMLSRVVGTLAHPKFSTDEESRLARNRVIKVYRLSEGELDELLRLARRGSVQAVERELAVRRSSIFS